MRGDKDTVTDAEAGLSGIAEVHSFQRRRKRSAAHVPAFDAAMPSPHAESGCEPRRKPRVTQPKWTRAVELDGEAGGGDDLQELLRCEWTGQDCQRQYQLFPG